MKMEKDCLGSRLWQHCLTAYTNSVLQLKPTVSYSSWQHCLTAYGDNVLQLICGKVGVFPGYLKLLLPLMQPK
jgi:hypothetical protein